MIYVINSRRAQVLMFSFAVAGFLVWINNEQLGSLEVLLGVRV